MADHTDDDPDELPTVPERLLARTSGGMRWEDFRPSTNVEDRRGWTHQQHDAVPPQYLPAPQAGPRTPGDLPSQAGPDDIKVPRRRGAPSR